MRRRREKQVAMKIEEVAMNWNNFYATLPISIFTPPCREPTSAVSATFGNRPAALSSSGGDVGAHQCPRFHLKLFAAQIGEVSWCKTWIRNVQVLEHYGTKRCISSHSFPSLVQSFFHHYFQLWTSFLDSSTQNGSFRSWLAFNILQILSSAGKQGWVTTIPAERGRPVYHEWSSCFFQLPTVLLFAVTFGDLFSAQPQHAVPAKAETEDRILYIKKVLGGKRVTSVQGKWLDSTLSLTELSKNNIIQIEVFCSGDMND